MYGEADEAESAEVVVGGKGLPPEVESVAKVVGLALAQRANTPEEIDAKIANLTAMKQKIPALALYYDNQIRKLRARRTALARSEQHTGQWRSLGQTAVGVGIAFGGALTVFVISEAFRRRAPRRNGRAWARRR